jgi:hypothetical protein
MGVILSIQTSCICLPEAGVIVKVILSPEFTVDNPGGEMLPPAQAVASIVNVGEAASRGLTGWAITSSAAASSQTAADLRSNRLTEHHLAILQSRLFQQKGPLQALIGSFVSYFFPARLRHQMKYRITTAMTIRITIPMIIHLKAHCPERTRVVVAIVVWTVGVTEAGKVLDGGVKEVTGGAQVGAEGGAGFIF